MTEWWHPAPPTSVPQQGQLLFACTLVELDIATEVPNGTIGNYIVLGQTCDIEHGKLRRVPLAPVVSYDAYIRQSVLGLTGQQRASRLGLVTSKGFIEGLNAGNHNLLHLLPPYSGADLAMPWSLAQFASVITVPRSQLVEWCEDAHAQRLQLNIPDREALAHAYARSVSRPALTQDYGVFARSEGLAIAKSVATQLVAQDD